MVKYLLIAVIIFILYLARNKLIEPLGPLVMTDNSPTEDNNEGEIDVYITNNQINYDKLDATIENIIRQQQLLEYNIKNTNFNLGYVDNSLYATNEPNVTTGGSYPRDIKINFAFPPPRPGGAGDQGDKGDKGKIGPKGPTGKRGSLGGNNYC
jgi:hypothetical protein